MYPVFRRLLAVRLISQTADGLFQAGLATLVLFSPYYAATPAEVALGLPSYCFRLPLWSRLLGRCWIAGIDVGFLLLGIWCGPELSCFWLG